MSSQDVMALQQLKDAALWFIVISILSDIGIISSIAAVASIVGLILLFIMGIPKLRQAFQSFAFGGKDVQNGFTGLRILPIGVIIEVIGGILAVVGLATAFAGVVRAAIISLIGGIFALLGAIVVFIAGLLIGLTLYNLGNFYNDDMLKIGGILEIIPVVSIVGWILVYIGVDDAVRKLTGVPYPQPPQYYQPVGYQPMGQVSQMGVGTIRSNGEARFTLYSPTAVGIMSASIENTMYTATQITPNTLNPGNNDVIVRFNNLSGMIPGNNYIINLVLSNGQVVKVMVTYQP